ncbi:MAG TPA: response regulator [Candidatus Marinimicrobia bacterium]|nr:response regulator [Candidatus Neomarinimicrobiota bacterium]
MQNSRGHILWIDDEIHHLKPHILFLEDKGYTLSQAANGQDGIALSEKNDYDLILLDQSMPGMDGLETLAELKKIRTTMPVIMITKTEDEWLMDEAITGQVEQFLIKPVNPSQIFMACKQTLEQIKLREQKATSDYLKEFQEIDARLRDDLSADDWWELYDRLVDWQIKFDKYKDTGLGSILEEQIQSCNREFSHFIESNYESWMRTNNRPTLSPDIVSKYVQPILEQDKKVCLLVVDCMRHDHFKSMMDLLEPFFNIVIDYKFSLLPTATPYSRNAIFSGLYPDEMVKKYPQQAEDMKNNAPSLNQHEKQFLIDQLKKYGLRDKRVHYHKIWAVEEGKKFQNRIKDYIQQDVLALVVNFVDILAHKSSQMDVLKEMVPDESGYRTAVRSWLEHSWLLQVLKKLSENNFTVILTSDHGSIRVQHDVMVAAGREASSGVRYKFGRNLNTREKNALVIKEPEKFRLPSFGPQPSYIVAKDDIYFIYPNQAHKYQAKFKNSFQHGGISMEEMMVPVVIMKGRG